MGVLGRPASLTACAMILVATALPSSGCRNAGAKPRRLAQNTAPHLTVPPPDPKSWPDLLPEEREIDAEVGVKRSRPVVVYLDAGHGAADNPGNTGTFCGAEQDFTRELALDVIAYLEEIRQLVVIPSRTGGKPISYSDRIAEARREKADVFVSLHSDIRGTHRDEWSPNAGLSCKRSFDAPGFSVLYADEGDNTLVTKRLSLAHAISESMIDVGFVPYEGAEYRDLYEGTPASEGVFVDRHAPDKRIYVLRRTTMPAVIVETHNALDPREAIAWQEPIVRRAFALALGRAVLNAIPVETSSARQRSAPKL